MSLPSFGKASHILHPKLGCTDGSADAGRSAGPARGKPSIVSARITANTLPTPPFPVPGHPEVIPLKALLTQGGSLKPCSLLFPRSPKWGSSRHNDFWQSWPVSITSLPISFMPPRSLVLIPALSGYEKNLFLKRPCTLSRPQSSRFLN